MSDRLTVSARDSLIISLTNKAFGGHEASFKKRNADLMHEVVQDYHRADWAKMSKLPKGMLRTISKFRLRFRGNGTDIVFNATPIVVRYDFGDDHWSTVDFSMDELKKKLSEAVYAKLDTFVKEYNAYLAEREKFRIDAHALLYSVTTYKKLYEVWPEVAQVRPPVESPKSTGGQQLAPLTAHLNAALGLKPNAPAK